MQKLKALFAVGSTVAAGSVFAAVPSEVTESLTEAGTDAAVIGGAVLVVLVGIAAFKYMRRAM
ncbi:major capsid protein [Stutzerimonas stutzeri]|uniref:Major capsid protein n=1 Tax=Stutzerimonas stutzeri TaxID=316 RepID=A0AA42HBV0_STUST|nr:major capsid protein [Stutzerimonas stutzeri]MDH0149195.1 major capsid protein [Stutzerimonas stutzeri]MDH0153641.1 major capsid protein [Stutzerimonas stutzeri]